MLLTDTFGWVKRNLPKMNDVEKRKMLNEINQMKNLLERNIKVKGAV